jgi:subtilisin family serine protease
VTDVSRLLRGTPPFLVALTVASAFALPANAAQSSSAARGSTATQPARAAQWWLTALHVPQAWQAAPGAGRGITVAVLSTGVDAAHRDLSGTVTPGPDYSASGRTAGSQFWGAEGTAAASLIAGHGHGPGGADGITGVAPGARILSVRVTLEYNDPLNSDTAITRRLPDAIAAGIRYAVGHGARVIALPLDPGTLGLAATGDPAAAGGSPAERAAVSYALGRDVVLVAPAGDNGAGTGTVNYPAAYPGVIAVGATTRNGQLAPFTITRPYVALTAPGSGLTVATPGGGYDSLASTDMSSALTAGVAALIRSRFPRLTAAEVTQALERGAAKPRARAVPGTGHGALDAAGALAAAAAIAATHPASGQTARSSQSAPARSHAAVSGATPRRGGIGALAGSVLRDAVIAAGTLIVALAGALVLSNVRRRRALAARAPQLPRAGQGGGSHARRPAALPRAGHRGQPGTLGTESNAGSTGPRIVPMPAGGRLGMAGRGRGRRKTAGQPPWEPASPPETALPTVPRAIPPPGARLALPAAGGQPRTGPDRQVPPWEQAPEEFTTAPARVDLPDWTPSNTGPMYVWNPASTGPLPATPGDAADREENRKLSRTAGWSLPTGGTAAPPLARAASLGELGLHVGRVQVHVFLAGQLPDRLHHLVGDGTPRLRRRFARQVAELQRLADPDFDLRRPQHRRARRQHLPGAHHRHRDHRGAGVKRQPAEA